MIRMDQKLKKIVDPGFQLYTLEQYSYSLVAFHGK